MKTLSVDESLSVNVSWLFNDVYAERKALEAVELSRGLLQRMDGYLVKAEALSWGCST